MSGPWNAGPAEQRPSRLRATLRRQFAPPTIVLLYHRVVPEAGRDVNLLATSTANFVAHLDWLAANTRPLRVAEFLGSLGRSGVSQLSFDGGKPRVLITFDDGYADNFHHALPLLAERGLEAIVFPLAEPIGTGQPFWWDALEQVVFDGQPASGGWKLPNGTLVPAHADRSITYRVIHATLKPLPDDARRKALSDLAEQSGLRPQATADSRPMNWRELRGWAAAGLSVGGHAWTHSQLSALSVDEICEEIAGCKRALEQRLGLPVDTFAYPFGGRDDFDALCEDAVRSAGFSCAFANRPGNARWARSRYALPRCLVRNWTGDELAEHMQRWCRP